MAVRTSRTIRLGQLGLLAGFVVVLQYLATSGLVGNITLAAPTAMVSTMVDLLASGAIVNDVVRTTSAVLAAFLLAVVVGVPIGWLLWRYGTLQRVLDPYLIAYYAMPVFAFYPLLIALFGLNELPIVLIAFAMSVVAIVINTANGFGQVREVFADVGRSLNLTRWQSFRHVFLPAATPYIFTGLKLGFIYALIGVIASEFILANAGLGFQVSYDYRNFATDRMYAVMLLVVIFAVVANVVLRRIEDRLYRRSVSR